jgi:hypothetical protein
MKHMEFLDNGSALIVFQENEKICWVANRLNKPVPPNSNALLCIYNTLLQVRAQTQFLEVDWIYL